MFFPKTLNNVFPLGRIVSYIGDRRAEFLQPVRAVTTFQKQGTEMQFSSEVGFTEEIKKKPIKKKETIHTFLCCMYDVVAIFFI